MVPGHYWINIQSVWLKARACSRSKDNVCCVHRMSHGKRHTIHRLYIKRAFYILYVRYVDCQTTLGEQMRDELKKTMGARTAPLVTGLYDRNQRVFDVALAAKLMGVSQAAARTVLHSAARRGLVTRVQRGVYNLVPFELGTADVHFENRYALAAAVVGSRPYYLSHASALDLHRLTTQPNFSVYVSTPQRLATRDVAGNRLQFVTVPADRLYGVVDFDLGEGRRVRVSDIERTLVDGLTLPRYCGGLIEVAKAFYMAGARADLGKLLAYAEAAKRHVVIRRLGFLLELFSLAPESALQALRLSLPQGLVAFDPDLPVKGVPCDYRWGLRLNLTANEIRAAVSH